MFRNIIGTAKHQKLPNTVYTFENKEWKMFVSKDFQKFLHFIFVETDKIIYAKLCLNLPFNNYEKETSIIMVIIIITTFYVEKLIQILSHTQNNNIAWNWQERMIPMFNHFLQSEKIEVSNMIFAMSNHPWKLSTNNLIRVVTILITGFFHYFFVSTSILLLLLLQLTE